MSDCHALPSHAVPATRPASVLPDRPKLLPIRVTLVDPLPALFARGKTLRRMKSADIPRDKLPTLIPDVTSTRRVPAATKLSLHSIPLSDTQSLPSQAVYPVRGRALDTASPRSNPCNIILVDPVAPRFALIATLAVPPSTDKLELTLPTPTALERDIRRLFRTPCPV